MDDPVPVSSIVTDSLDWAADDAGELPSINSLHERFGTSGDITPEVQKEEEPTSVPQEIERAAQVNGAHHNEPTPSDDGFTAVGKGPRNVNGEGHSRGDRSRGRGFHRGLSSCIIKAYAHITNAQ